MMFKKFTRLALLATIAMTAVHPADARRGNEQTDLREQQRAGQVLTTRQIEDMVLPRMRGMEYLGPQYDSRSQVYVLKFMNRDRVVFVEVDARSGSILRQR